jgi:hypothetical protein
LRGEVGRHFGKSRSFINSPAAQCTTVTLPVESNSGLTAMVNRAAIPPRKRIVTVVKSRRRFILLRSSPTQDRSQDGLAHCAHCQRSNNRYGQDRS